MKKILLMCLTMLLISQTIVLGQTHRTKKRVVKKTTTTSSQLNKGKKRPTSMDTLLKDLRKRVRILLGHYPH